MQEIILPLGEKEQPPDQAIVAFIDIFGYESLVNRLIGDMETVKNIENLLKGLLVDILEALRQKSFYPGPYGELAKEIFLSINAKYISDTILLTLPLSDTATASDHFDQTERLSHRIFAYLLLIAKTCTWFTAKTGHVMRGGISMGSHYENPHKGSLFIFSQAYMNAYKLEKKADTARILLAEDLFGLIKGLPLVWLNKLAFEDNGDKCLDIYFPFESDQQARTILFDIRKLVQRNMFRNSQNKAALRKLIKFAKFHNERVIQLGFGDLAFELSRIEEIYETL